MKTTRYLSMVLMVVACVILPAVSAFGGGRRELLTDPSVAIAAVEESARADLELPYPTRGMDRIPTYVTADLPYPVRGLEAAEKLEFAHRADALPYPVRGIDQSRFSGVTAYTQ
jgi:hypothetical protein